MGLSIFVERVWSARRVQRSVSATHDKTVTGKMERWLACCACCLVALALGGCAPSHQRRPLTLCSVDDQSPGCLDTAAVEALLTDPDARLIDAESTGSGSAGAYLLTLQASTGTRTLRFRAKWRAHTTASATNSPRKEVVAYFAQQLFLDPGDYVFPPTRSRCFDLDQYRAKVDSGAEASFRQASNCVYGVISFWLDGAERFVHPWWPDDPILSESRWAEDPVYRRTLADANLLAYFTANGDTHIGNWVTLETDRGQRVYLVDGSISLSRMGNLSLGPTEDFANLIVPALRRKSLERLVGLGERQLSQLLTVEQLTLDGNTLTSERALDESHGAGDGLGQDSTDALRWVTCSHSGTRHERLLLGMNRHELSLIERQVWHLAARHAMGELELMPDREARGR